MKRILTISLLVCFYNTALGQVADSNAIFLMSKGEWDCPVSKFTSATLSPKDTGSSDFNPDSKEILFVSDSAYEVRSVYPGKIIFADVYNDSLFIIISKHGGYFTVYSALGKLSVKNGDKIKVGEKIGYMSKESEKKYTLFLGLYMKEKEIESFTFLGPPPNLRW
ncbi:MAG: M23 family metallopeptidase [Chitinophagaceae bacterium]|nr:M23 family metallopeptidase [Chitinophagaceae bacterium]